MTQPDVYRVALQKQTTLQGSCSKIEKRGIWITRGADGNAYSEPGQSLGTCISASQFSPLVSSPLDY